jgi:hypothetical protein
MTKGELFAAIRRDARLKGLGVRALSRKYGVHSADGPRGADLGMA